MPQPAAKGTHVELVDISKSFGGVRALDEVSLKIGRGSIHALVGENGAGKSTLGKILAGVITPDRGQLLIDGEPATFHSPREAIIRRIVLIAQELSIARSARSACGCPRSRRRSARCPGATSRRPCSPGSCCGDRAVLVADEPTRGVDVGAKRAIYELLTSLAAEGLGVLFISSDTEEILGLAHRVLVMRAGRIAAEFGSEAMTEAAILGAAFGAPEIGRERGA